MRITRPTTALWTISVAVLLASATWLSASAVSPALVDAWRLSSSEAAWLSGSVQLGFVSGTLIFAVFNIADQFNARWVFLVSAWLGAAFNAGFGLLADDLLTAVLFRFATGVMLAGVYPVGMKLVASWFSERLGWQLGVMVGALVLGTSSPFFFRATGHALPWRAIIGAASGAAILGGLLVLLVTDGPFLKKRAAFEPKMLLRVFALRRFRLQSIAYFGHCWELYAVWTLTPFFLADQLGLRGSSLAWLSFLVVAVGAIGCGVGGWLSHTLGERLIALVALIVSGTICLTIGWWVTLPLGVVVVVFLVWGVAVVADSPQFSALAVRSCPPEYTGTALTVQNGVGFAITAASIQLLPLLADAIGWRWTFLALAPGPAIGVWALWKLGKQPDG